MLVCSSVSTFLLLMPTTVNPKKLMNLKVEAYHLIRALIF